MRRVVHRNFALVTALVLALGFAGAQGNAPRVMVNGVLLNAPIREVKGSLLLPMRAVFEALQAEVSWFPAERQITATRGTVTVQLWIDRGVAIVNDREIPLAVPPTLIGGTTYVPLRFPAEAFGGNVEWRGAERLAVVTIAPLPDFVKSNNNNPPPPVPAEVTGVLIAHAAAKDGESLFLREQKAGELLTMTAPAGTAVTRNREAAAFADLQPGDLIVMTRDAAGKITGVSAAYLLVSGKVAGVAESKLLLQDGGVYLISPQARAEDARGNAVALADLKQGQEVTLRLTPGTPTIWAITVPTPMPAPDPVQIVSVGAPGYARPLKQGDTLTLQVTGIPGARVTARVGEAIPDVELTELEPGRYSRQITIAANLPATDAPIVAVLRLGEETRQAQSEEKIVIDEQVPVCRPLDPAPDAPIFDPNPVIMAAFGDDGSGIDPRTVRLLVNGKDVTAGAEVTEQSIRYPARGLPLGATRFRLEMADRAGNVTAQDWQVDIREPQPEQEPEIYAVTHDAARPLRRGDILAIRVTATPGADRVTARVGEAITGIELTEHEAGRYTGEVTIGTDLRVNNVPVYATLREGNVVREAESVQRVTVDTRPPQYAMQTQEPAEIYERDYPIGASFSDDDSGIDAGSVRLLLNGRDVTHLAVITDHDIRYNAVNLPYGASIFRLEMTDRAGNATSREWQVIVREKPPMIVGVSHDAATMLKQGDTLTIRVVGTPGADGATARIGNAVTNIILEEDKPGRYSRRIIIRENVHASDVYVYAVLHRHGLDSEEVRSDRRLTLDSEEPQCRTVLPRRNAVVLDQNPVIQADYSDDGAGIATGKVKLLVNGQDVTAQATVSDHQIRYTAQGLPLGVVNVVLTLEDKVGNTTRVEWPFTIQAPPAILGVSHNATKTLDPGETVTITARLSITPARLEWLLDEQVISQEAHGNAAGVYTAIYTIKPADAAGKHRVGLRCFKGDGQSETVYASATLTITTLKAKDLAITSPDDKSKAPESLTVVGVATPNAQVRVTVNAARDAKHMDEIRQVTVVTLKTSGDGLWATQSIALPREKNTRLYIVTAELLDDKGAVVKTATIRLTR